MSQRFGRGYVAAGLAPGAAAARSGAAAARSRPDPAQSERGSLTLMLLVMFVSLVALAGIVIDGGAKLTAAENATSIAQEAARAGAGRVNQQTAYASGRFIVDIGQAEAAANEYLATAATAGVTGSAGQGPGPNTIEVTVTIRQPTKVLSILGIDSMTVTGHATASLESGVTGPGQ